MHGESQISIFEHYSNALHSRDNSYGGGGDSNARKVRGSISSKYTPSNAVNAKHRPQKALRPEETCICVSVTLAIMCLKGLQKRHGALNESENSELKGCEEGQHWAYHMLRKEEFQLLETSPQLQRICKHSVPV